MVDLVTTRHPSEVSMTATSTTRPDPICEVCGHPVIFKADHTPERHASVLNYSDDRLARILRVFADDIVAGELPPVSAATYLLAAADRLEVTR
jgi:hypothetical protein